MGLICVSAYLCMCVFLYCSLCVSDESDYHTDYEEELVGSTLSDMEPTNYCSEHTEEELTADTVRIHNHTVLFYTFHLCLVII